MVGSGPIILDALPWIIGGLISALLWFVLARILEQQQEAANGLEEVYRMVKTLKQSTESKLTQENASGARSKLTTAQRWGDTD